MALREKVAVMEAFERGKVDITWDLVDLSMGDWATIEYRIKPKPKQVVLIEKWLIYDNLSKSYSIAEESNIDGYISDARDYLSKVRLLYTKTYEVEL